MERAIATLLRSIAKTLWDVEFQYRADAQRTHCAACARRAAVDSRPVLPFAVSNAEMNPRVEPVVNAPARGYYQVAAGRVVIGKVEVAEPRQSLGVRLPALKVEPVADAD